MDEIENKDLKQVSGGTDADEPHCPKCRSTDIELTGPADFGTPPCYRCKSCGYEWMMAL